MSATMLREAARLLAGMDADRAEVSNGVGYSKADGGFGHSLAATPPEAWSAEVTRAAWVMLRRYRSQLLDAGFDFDAVAEPAAGTQSREIRTVDHDGGRFVLRFGYSPALIADVKRLPGRRWDHAVKVWTVPASDPLTRLIAMYDFRPTAAATAAFAMPPDPGAVAPLGSVDQDGPRLFIRTDYDAALVAAIKDIPGRRWDAAARAWVTPISSVVPVREVADRFGLTWNVSEDVEDVDPTIRPTVEARGGELHVMFDYDRDLVAAVRDLPGARWNRSLFAWVLPVAAAADVLEFVTAAGGTIAASADRHFAAARDAAARIADSAATDADLDVPGLGGELMPFQRAGVAYALRALGYVADGSGLWVSAGTVQKDLTPV